MHIATTDIPVQNKLLKYIFYIKDKEVSSTTVDCKCTPKETVVSSLLSHDHLHRA